MIFNQLEAIVQCNDHNDDKDSDIDDYDASNNQERKQIIIFVCVGAEKIGYLDADTYENTICDRYTTSYGN